ncbi:calcium homeostasis modulator protein-like [Limulus polyphemus]|uniref:Calcium homeostasis modulator protein-like n=1 Tax=Limulus polyphemus TaxID=6850 RepID=A0ABM1S7I7_LIMPO|nr:calcium homeostasis modulator protein-like [Limulus polyphemus]
MINAALSSSVFNSIGNNIKKYQVSFVNGTVVMITVVGETIFKYVAFKCPCSQPDAFLYGSSFICGPAVILFIIGMLINNTTWRLLYGCAKRSHHTNHGPKRSAYYCTEIIVRSLVAPGTWLFVSFLEGSYYTCLKSHSPCSSGSEDNLLLRAHSQVIAWIYLATVVTFSFLGLMVNRCLSKYTYDQSRYIDMYRETEEDIFDNVMKEKTVNKAKKNVSLFFEKKDRIKKDWDEISIAPLADLPFGIEQVDGKVTLELLKHYDECKEPYMSPLHQWAKRQRQSCTSKGNKTSDDEDQPLLSQINQQKGKVCDEAQILVKEKSEVESKF